MARTVGRLMSTLTIAVIVYTFVCLLTFVFQRSLIYFPWKWDEETARRANPGYEDVRFPTSDGESLHGWLHRRNDASWTVVIFHGNGGNLSVQDALMAPFVSLDLQVLIFDYRGFGLSTGKPTQEGLLRDGEAAVAFVENQLGVPSHRLVLFGKSLGAGVAGLVARKKPPGRLILESSFESLAAVGARHYFYLPVGLLIRDRFDVGSIIGELSCPVLFTHPSRDEIVPPDLGRALFERAREPKQFLSIPNARHNDPPYSFPPIYLETIRDFLKTEP
jgi:fermentation-respiration switch protein FrsA (DUF1100 family)